MFLNNRIAPDLVGGVNRHDGLRPLLRSIPLPFVHRIFAGLCKFRALVGPVVQVPRPLVIRRYLVSERFKILRLIGAFDHRLYRPLLRQFYFKQ